MWQCKSEEGGEVKVKLEKYWILNFTAISATLRCLINHGPLALDALLVPKISKRHFFQDIKNSFHGVTQMGLEPHQNFFQNFFSTNMVVRGGQSFCILEGAADPLIEP